MRINRNIKYLGHVGPDFASFWDGMAIALVFCITVRRTTMVLVRILLYAINVPVSFWD